MFTEAKHLYKWFLKTFGYVAIVNPFSRVCHVLGDYFPPSEHLKKHEKTHMQQIDKEGALKFCFKYLWFSIIYGYANNPYEVEARKK